VTNRVRRATKDDAPFLWQMLYYAAHMDEDGASPESAKNNPDLAGYVEEWGERAGDLGIIAIADDGHDAGAAWIRVMPPTSPLYQVVAPGIPELAIAVAPECIGTGVGTILLRALLQAAHGIHRAIALSVRASNPAQRLYARAGFTTIAEVTNRVGTISHVMKIDLS
jgi:ribosomal protein S18 acetylase RimI-like enzyme